MFRMVSSLAVDHDWRLVALAIAICFLTSVVTISSLNRAQATRARTRTTWLALGAFVAGFGIWSTHFIALLAYSPAFGVSFNVLRTAASLLFAVVLTGAGLSLALKKDLRWAPAFGGAV